jgi:hypothetical protein
MGVSILEIWRTSWEVLWVAHKLSQHIPPPTVLYVFPLARAGHTYLSLTVSLLVERFDLLKTAVTVGAKMHASISWSKTIIASEAAIFQIAVLTSNYTGI